MDQGLVCLGSCSCCPKESAGTINGALLAKFYHMVTALAFHFRSVVICRSTLKYVWGMLFFGKVVSVVILLLCVCWQSLKSFSPSPFT